MATSSFSILSNDILTVVLTQLKRISETSQDLTSCSLVDRRWHEATTPFLYGNIALNRDNLVQFCNHAEVSKYCAYVHVHSLTITCESVRILEPVAQLVPLLPQFTNLRSFSFWPKQGFLKKFSQAALVQLVDALPASCTNLELEIHDFAAPKEGEEPHLCDALRKILPRMQHVRLQIRACEALFADPSTPDTSLRLPNLKTLVYNCFGIWGLLPTCRRTDTGRMTLAHSEVLWYVVTNRLEKLVSTPNAVPEDAKLYALVNSEIENHNGLLWQTYIRAEMQSQSSVAMPHRGVWMEGSIPGSWVIRMPDDIELMSTFANAGILAEGQLWREVLGGARLPAAVLAAERAGKASFAVGCVEKGLSLLRTSEQWRKDNPRKGTRYWGDERKTGEKTVCVVERKGKGDYLSLNPICEITPPGWKRVGDEGTALERIEG
ncbi:hypothetical protein CC86DRAFT_369807 [Ophiobolus disseminans]|uniref:F-box domain-containing protein n=1 Tax=Ophiobolus disseminans TaxID=1469910 RepID=A0A6A7A3N0_9PLEO|nr:hypothetical protein CC86DRAFT_369807 [Ophiobolus disseminans]